MIGRWDARDVLRRLDIAWTEKAGGRKLGAPCPFGTHDDVHPSWEINVTGPSANLHLCRSCKVGGDLITLVALVRKLGDPRGKQAFKAALAWLRGNVSEAPPEPPRTIRVVIGSSTRRGFQLPPEVVGAGNVDAWTHVPRSYVLEDRGLTEDQVRRHKVGYAADGRLAGRIVVPTLDKNGEPASYAARTFVDDEPRYLTPHHSEEPDKSVLFGEHTWTDQTTVYVAEGAFKLLAVERAIPGAALAGLSGSNVHPMAISRLSAFDDLVIVGDEDLAGEGATAYLFSAFARHKIVKVARFPKGADADVVAKRSVADLRAMLDAAC